MCVANACVCVRGLVGWDEVRKRLWFARKVGAARVQSVNELFLPAKKHGGEGESACDVSMSQTRC